MPQVAVAAIGAAVGGVAAGVSTTAIIGRMVVASLLSGASMLLQKKPKSNVETLSGTTVTGYGADNPRVVVYGRSKVGGTIFFQHSTGSNNEFLHICVAFAGHEIEDFDEVYFGNYKLTIAGDGSVSAGVNSTGETVNYSNYSWVYKHLGSLAQTADTNLISDAPDKWTSYHTASSVAYLYVKLRWSSTLFPNGLPQITAVVRGKKVYDPRTETTAYSNNSALCLADFLINFLGAETTEVYNDSLTVAANICDEQIVDVYGDTVSRWMANGSFDTSQSPEEIITQLRASMAGICSYIGGQFIFYAGSWRTPEAVGLSEADFIGNPTIQTSIQRSDLFNAVKGTYLSPDNDWVAADFPSIKSDTYMAQDGGQRLWLDMTLAFVTSSGQAQRLSKIELLRGRQPITVQVKTPLSSCRFLIGDIIPFTYTRMGWSGKYFEVNNMEFALDSDASGSPFVSCNLTLRETAILIYDWSVDEESPVDIAPNTNLPSPFTIETPTNITLSSGTSELFVRADGTIWTRIRVSWTASARESVRSGGHYEIQYKKSSDSTWSNSAPATGDATQAYINDVEDGVRYDVRIRALSFIGTFSEWASYTNYEVIGKTEAPLNASGFLVRRLPDGTRKYTWTPPVGVYDLAGYEIRYSNITSETWDDMDALHNGVLTSSPYESNNPPTAGTYRFAIKSIDRSGNYSTNAVYVTATLGAARITGTIASYDFRLDYDWAGTLTDCHVDSGNGNIEADGGTQWDSATTWDSMTSWMDGCSSPITYETNSFDLGSSQTYVPTLESVGSGTHTRYFRYSADGISWSSYSSTLTETTSRYIQFKVTSATSGSNSPTIESFTATLNIA